MCLTHPHAFCPAGPVAFRYDRSCTPTVDTVKALRRAGKRTFFVTNNSSKSRRQYCRKLEGFGVHGVGVEDIVTSGSAIAGEGGPEDDRKGLLQGTTTYCRVPHTAVRWIFLEQIVPSFIPHPNHMGTRAPGALHDP